MVRIIIWYVLHPKYTNAEIIRVMGGPSIGDIRSRLVRLAAFAMTQKDRTSQLGYADSREAVFHLMSHRLPLHGSHKEVKQEWMEIIEGKHRLWRGIDPDKRECIRGFLVLFQSEVLHRAHRNFNFRGGCIGNFFLASMQRFFRSIQSAIFMFAAVSEIPFVLSSCDVLPAVNTNKTTTIAADLKDGSLLVGQCEISHPSDEGTRHRRLSSHSRFMNRRVSDLQDSVFGFGPQSMTQNQLDQRRLGSQMESHSAARASSSALSIDDSDLSEEDQVLDDDPREITELTESSGNIEYVAKEDAPPLPSPIDRTFYSRLQAGVFYVNVRNRFFLPRRFFFFKAYFLQQSYRNEVFPAPNPSYLTGLQRSKIFIYSCGSLWTSVIPCLVLRGIPLAIARSPTLQFKVLLLNSKHDRETANMTGLDFVKCVMNCSVTFLTYTQRDCSVAETDYASGYTK